LEIVDVDRVIDIDLAKRLFARIAALGVTAAVTAGATTGTTTVAYPTSHFVAALASIASTASRSFAIKSYGKKRQKKLLKILFIS
jgi:diacylglycerol kinase family enzyme